MNSTRHIKGLGFQGKMCIHPDQVPIVNEILSPSAAEVEWSRKVGAGLRGGRESRLRLHPARGQVHRLPDRLSCATRARDDAAHRCPRASSSTSNGDRHGRRNHARPPSHCQADAGHPGHRRVELSCRPLLLDPAGGIWCRGHQDRAAEGRRCPAQIRHHHEERRLAPLVAGVPQQEVGHAGSEEAGGRRDPEAVGHRRPMFSSRTSSPARWRNGVSAGTSSRSTTTSW